MICNLFKCNTNKISLSLSLSVSLYIYIYRGLCVVVVALCCLCQLGGHCKNSQPHRACNLGCVRVCFGLFLPSTVIEFAPVPDDAYSRSFVKYGRGVARRNPDYQ